MATKKSRTLLFWSLQFIGWGIPALLNMVGKLLLVKDLNTSYIIVEAALMIVFGILISTCYRYIIKRHVVLGAVDAKAILIGFIAYVISAFLIGIFLEYGARFAYHQILDKSMSRTLDNLFSSFVNMALFLFFWTVLYYSIKAYFKYQDDQLDRAHLVAAAKEAQLNTLKGQINPHFMFNSLNNIRGLMLEDVDKARDMLTQLSEMLRFSLTKQDAHTIPLAEELEVVNNYVALSKIQLEDRLQYFSEIDAKSLEAPVPPMLLQLLVENAIKHGISNLKEGGVVQVKSEISEKMMLLKVSNTGVLQPSSDTTQLGIKNIEKRLKLLYGTKARFNLEQDNKTVVATVKLPINE